MKKEVLNKYILFVFVSFLSFLGIGNAATNEMAPGEVVFISNNQYDNLSCSVSDVGDVDYTNPFMLEKVSGGYKIIYSNGTEAGRKGIVTCTYDEVGIGGKVTQVLDFNLQTKNVSDGVINLGPTGVEENILEITGADKIIDIRISGDYVELVEGVNCPADYPKCILRPTPEGIALAGSGRDLVADIEIVYVNKYGQELTSRYKVPVDVYSGGRAYPGGVGKCHFDNKWTERTWYGDSQYQKYNYYQGTTGAVLPDCTPENPILEVEFKGWVSGLANNNNYIVQATGGCDGAIPAGTPASSTDVYYACYEMEPTVQLAIGEGNIDNISDWKYSTGRGYYYVGSGNQAILPGVKFVGYEEGKTLKGWMNNGEIRQPGTPVDLDGKIWTALIETTHYYEPNRYNKRVYVDDSTDLVVEGITGCELVSGSSYLSVNYNSGSCLVTGISATPDGVTADVKVKTGSGDQIFKFNVVSLSGEAQNGGEEFIIDTSANVNYNVENTSYEKDGLIFDIPNTFLIKKGDGYKVNEQIGSSFNYWAIWPENGVDVQHLTFCLDPGIKGPGAGTMYKKDELQYTGDFDKLISYLGEEVIKNDPNFKDTTNINRIASSIAVRLVAFQNNIDNGTNGVAGGELRRHYNSYRSAANALSQIKSNYTSDGIKNILSTNMGIGAGAIADKVTEILMHYSSHEAKGMGTDFSREITSKTTNRTGNNSYTIHYTGTITMPDGATTVPTIDTTECNANSGTTGVRCLSASISGNNFDVLLSIDDASKVKIPKSAEEKKKMSVKVTVGGGATVKNIYLASPAKSGEVKQRMIIFDFTGSGASAYMYLDVFPDRERCKDIAALNPDSCLTPTSCSINRELFNETGCCEEITDTVKYAYILQAACSSGCTTTTFESVCSYSPGNEDKSQLYEIKEGTVYNGSSYLNNIGNCIVNVSDNYGSGASFERSDDKGNSINVDAYNGNRYCTVTCKEDWKISMDSFGNYVGKRSVAAGTWFRVDNDIFIGGERTCYTNFLNYDKYMNDLVTQSKLIVKEYNNYSNNSHAYTDLSDRTSADVTSSKTEDVCVLWQPCPSNYTWDGSVCKTTNKATDTVTDETPAPTLAVPNPTKQYKHTFSCSAPAPTGGNGAYSSSDVDTTAPSSVTDSSSSKITTKDCTYTINLKCKTKGSYYSYTLPTKGNVGTPHGKYKRYTTKTLTTTPDLFTAGSSIVNQNTIDTSTDTSYARTEKMTCDADDHAEPNRSATIKCVYSTTTTSPDNSVSISSYGYTSKTYCADPEPDNTNFCKASSGDNKSDALNDLQGKGKAVTQNAATSAKNKLGSYYNTVNKYAQDFFKCQNFYLYNTSDTRSANTKTNATYKALGNAVNPVEITTKFEPDVAYNYDEPAYMTILGKDNVLVPYDEKNEQVMPGYNASANNAEVDANVNFFTSSQPPSTVEVKLQRNKTETKYYNDSPWQQGTDAYTNYEGGAETSAGDFTVKQVVFCTAGSGYNTYVNNGAQEDPQTPYVGVLGGLTWSGGQCYTVKVRYRSAHYISSYIGNSSFYRNKGNWYHRSNDIKEHGDDFANALENANNRSSANHYNVAEEEKHWTRLANPYTNVFPISLNAPRNLYQYSYQFKGIGSDSSGKLGRLMGGDNPIIELNTRACFYEVHEELCLCCGSEISTYVEGSEGVTQDFVNNNPFSYDLPSDSQVINNKNGILNVNSSSFGLNDVASIYGSTNRDVPTNWSDASPFYYNGVNYLTEKGDVALKEIEAKGENIYSDTPEYSYFLTPSSLTAIRDYNAANGYEIRLDRLNVYGVYSIACPSASNCNIENPDIENSITFRHYGSKFLENFMYDLNAVQKGTLASSSNKKICTVTENVPQKEIANMVKTQNCRWIDYIQAPRSNDSKAENTYFRLAFK